MNTFSHTSDSWEQLSGSLGKGGADAQGGHAQHHDGPEAMDVYFECITTCSLDDGECVTRCVEELRNQP